KYAYFWCKWCKLCQTSGNEKIDDFIQEMQLKFNEPYSTIFEWIPYNQFNDIKELNRGAFTTIYSAIWKDGPLYYDWIETKWMRKSSEKIILKCIYNLPNIIDEFLDEVWNFSINYLILF